MLRNLGKPSFASHIVEDCLLLRLVPAVSFGGSLRDSPKMAAKEAVVHAADYIDGYGTN